MLLSLRISRWGFPTSPELGGLLASVDVGDALALGIQTELFWPDPSGPHLRFYLFFAYFLFFSFFFFQKKGFSM